MGNRRKAFVEGTIRTYEWVLELPMVIVLVVLWLAGTAVLGTCALLLYLYGLTLVRLLAG
jgi:hypothetical protein